jgi:hypothetical protein
MKKLDLASVAGSGDESKANLLNGYQQTNISPANAYLEIKMKSSIVVISIVFRPDNDHSYIKFEPILPSKKIHDMFTSFIRFFFSILCNETIDRYHVLLQFAQISLYV